jgi:transcriptional antiterminator RfaH
VERWYALFTKPRAEHRVAEALAARGLDVWLPRLVYHDRQRRPTVRPFFPRYLFGRFDWEQAGMVNVQWTPGLTRVVTFDGRPAWLADERLDYLRERLDRLDGDDFLALKPGERVRVTGGPFRDLEAVFDRRLNGQERVAVLLDILGRPTVVVLSGAHVERIA